MTWDTSHKQAVYFLPSATVDGCKAPPVLPVIRYKLMFDTAKGDLAIEFVLQ